MADRYCRQRHKLRPMHITDTEWPVWVFVPKAEGSPCGGGRLSRALQTFELRPTYEDVFQVEGSSVEEYLQQVHELTVITAIQVRLRDTRSPCGAQAKAHLTCRAPACLFCFEKSPCALYCSIGMRLLKSASGLGARIFPRLLRYLRLRMLMGNWALGYSLTSCVSNTTRPQHQTMVKLSVREPTYALLQEAQRESVAAFESFMGACLVADWARDKRALFDAAMPDSALPAPAGQLAPGGFEPAYAPMPVRAHGAMPGAGALQEIGLSDIMGFRVFQG